MSPTQNIQCQRGRSPSNISSVEDKDGADCSLVAGIMVEDKQHLHQYNNHDEGVLGKVRRRTRRRVRRRSREGTGDPITESILSYN